MDDAERGACAARRGRFFHSKENAHVSRLARRISLLFERSSEEGRQVTAAGTCVGADLGESSKYSSETPEA